MLTLKSTLTTVSNFTQEVAFSEESFAPMTYWSAYFAVALKAPRGSHDHTHILLGWLLVRRLLGAARLSKNALESGLSAV